MTEDRRMFLSTMPAERRDLRLAIAFMLVSVGIFLAAVQFAPAPRAPMPIFMPIYQLALVANNLLTAILLLSQFAILRSCALLVLSCG